MRGKDNNIEMSSREMATVLITKHIEGRIAISWRSTFGNYYPASTDLAAI